MTLSARIFDDLAAAMTRLDKAVAPQRNLGALRQALTMTGATGGCRGAFFAPLPSHRSQVASVESAVLWLKPLTASSSDNSSCNVNLSRRPLWR